MRKKLTLTLVTAVVFALSVFACDLSDLMIGNTSLARTIRQYEKRGYEVVYGDQTYYNQFRYFMEPVAPYVDGSGTVQMKKSAGNYSLQVDYININFEATAETNGRCTTDIIDITTQTVY